MWDSCRDLFEDVLSINILNKNIQGLKYPGKYPRLKYPQPKISWPKISPYKNILRQKYPGSLPGNINIIHIIYIIYSQDDISGRRLAVSSGWRAGATMQWNKGETWWKLRNWLWEQLFVYNSTMFVYKSGMYVILIVNYVLVSNLCIKCSDAPTGQFGSVQPNRSDKQWVRLVLAKNFQTPNGSVAPFLHVVEIQFCTFTILHIGKFEFKKCIF